jgi:hypothetical protein
MQYWINQNGTQAGPVTREEIEKMNVDPNAYVWRSGLNDWVKISNFPELSDIFDKKEAEVAEPVAAPVEEPQSQPDEEEKPQEETTEGEGSHTDSTDTEAVEPAAEEQPIADQQPVESETESEPESEPEQENEPVPPVTPEQSYEQPYQQQYSYSQQNSQPVEQPKCPPTNMAWSIIFTILCCNVLGIIAIIYSAKVSTKFREGDYEKAEKYSEYSAWWCIITIVTGIIFNGLFSILSMSILP